MNPTNNNIPEKRQHELISKLTAESDEHIISFITESKSELELFYLKPLIDMMLSERSENLKRTIVEFISEIKNNNIVPIVVDSLEKNFPQKNVTKLVTASWQSRLDFSKDLSIFFKILIKGNYQIAFEAFTVIENSLDNLEVEKINEFIGIVKKGVIASDRDKQLLLLEMVSILEKAKRAAIE